MDYRWKVTDTGRRSPGTGVPMVAKIHQRNVDVVKSMLPSAAVRPGFNPSEMRCTIGHVSLCHPPVHPNVTRNGGVGPRHRSLSTSPSRTTLAASDPGVNHPQFPSFAAEIARTTLSVS